MPNYAKFYRQEAYGAPKEPKFLYSKHNLQVKYGTTDPKEILIGRLQILKGHGYDPNERGLNSAEKEATVTLDYLEALLQTYRVRVQMPVFAEPYTESLYSNWKPAGLWGDDLDPKPMIKMLTNFCASMEICQLIISDYREDHWADFIRAWHNKVCHELEHDHDFYVAWRRELLKQIR